MIHHLGSNKRRQAPKRAAYHRITMLYPWEIPEIQDLDEVAFELSVGGDSTESEEDTEPGWSALMESTLRDEVKPSVAA